MSYKPLLKTRYEEVVVPVLKEKFGYKNVMEVPRLVKVWLLFPVRQSKTLS